MSLTLKDRTDQVQALAQATIAAERDEMHVAIIHLVEVLTAHCPAITTIHLEESDQGEWLEYDTATCTSHDADTCPAHSDQARDEAWQFAPHIYISQLGHLVDEYGCQRPSERGSLASLTIPAAAYNTLKEAIS